MSHAAGVIMPIETPKCRLLVILIFSGLTGALNEIQRKSVLGHLTAVVKSYIAQKHELRQQAVLSSCMSQVERILRTVGSELICLYT